MKRIITLALGFLALVSCKKYDSNASQQTNCNGSSEPQVDLATVDNFYFKNGTYWVYEDALTGAEDSVAITGNSYWTETIPTGSGGQCTYLVAMYDSYAQSYSSFELTEFEIKGIQWSVKTAVSGHFTTIYSDTIDNSEQIPSMTIGADTYTDVLKVQVPAGDYDGQYVTNLYICPGFGIIRKEIDPGGLNETIWNLVRHQIVI